MAALETRLDALVLRAGFARTIYQAGQAVSHGHIEVDGRKVDKPSCRVPRGRSSRRPPASTQPRCDAATPTPTHRSTHRR